MPRAARLKCKWQGCPAKFAIETALEEHEAVSHRECEGCGRFFHPSGITRHQTHCEDYQQYSLRRERDIQRRCSACTAVIHQGQHFLLISKLVLKTMMTVDIVPVSDTVIDHIVLCRPECFLTFTRKNESIENVFGPTPDVVPAPRERMYEMYVEDTPAWLTLDRAALVMLDVAYGFGQRVCEPDGAMRKLQDFDTADIAARARAFMRGE